MSMQDKLLEEGEGLFTNSKQTLLVFRTRTKFVPKDEKLKLTHQKRNDVFLSLCEPRVDEKWNEQMPKTRVYEIAEVLLQFDSE